MKTFDNKTIQNIIQNDQPGIHPDPAIEERLLYSYRLKRASGKIHRNSFLPFAGFLSGKFMVLKVSAVVAFFILTFHFQPWESGGIKDSFLCDSSQVVKQNIQIQDTLPSHSYLQGDSVLLK